ncbi:unnamed protein product [Prorocentrum cordatum]|uniref:Uncharacterized protein n=1 Tax=Prorocentrum cordatum TaxID=2364126 RepID=A0ABN9W8W6_9DINO|nr:unnamed protein product [Polarella glacialis]
MPGSVDAAWLSYEGGRSHTATDLLDCREWPHLRLLGLLVHRRLAPRAMLAVSIAYGSTVDIWQGSAADWVITGMRQACEHHGYGIGGASVIKYQANAPRLVVMVRLQEKSVSEPVRGLSGSIAEEAASVRSKGWEYWHVWEVDRPKMPTADSGRLFLVVQRISAALRRMNARSVFLHEPGFFIVLPALLDMALQVTCCAARDLVLSSEIARRGLKLCAQCGLDLSESEHCRAPEDADALLLLDRCGPAAWQRRWAALSREWLRAPARAGGLVALMFEGSDASALAAVTAGLLDGVVSARVAATATFVHSSRRWAFAIIHVGDDRIEDALLPPAH